MASPVEVLIKENRTFTTIRIDKISDAFEFLICALSVHWKKILPQYVVAQLFSILDSELLTHADWTWTTRFSNALFEWYMFTCAECEKNGVAVMLTEERSTKHVKRYMVNITPIRTKIVKPVQVHTVREMMENILRFFCGAASTMMKNELDTTIKTLNFERGSVHTPRLSEWISTNLVKSNKDPEESLEVFRRSATTTPRI